MAKIVKDIRAIDYWLSKLKGSLSEIKDKLTFISRTLGLILEAYT